MFVNSLKYKTASILFLRGRNYQNQFKCIYLKIHKLYVKCFLRSWNLHKILNNLKKKMSLIAEVFPKLLSPKNVFTEITTRTCLRAPFGIKHVNGSQTVLKFPRQHLHPTVSWLWDNLSSKSSPSFRSDILGPFVNILIASYRAVSSIPEIINS